ncbi:MAG: hypothetical protein EP343_21810 [Deltaproteobacteria bacterium]|nr:MAG: hypothetical protein EP343_21810 [Deltaproteobacteria bacterium]
MSLPDWNTHEPLPTQLTGPCGSLFWEAEWSERALCSLRLRLPDRSWIRIQTQVAERPLFGLCDAVYHDDASEPITYFRALDWAQPQWIPPLEVPGSLPQGAGTAILNAIALLAQRAGLSTLRYVGPYPTGALFDSLHTCFQVKGEPQAIFAQFGEGVEELALQPELREAPVDFVPAPFVPMWPVDSVCVQLREGPERAYLLGRSFHRSVEGSRRLRVVNDQVVATVEVGGEIWAKVATFALDGTLLEGPHELPGIPEALVGQPVHPGLCQMLAQALPPRAPAMMQQALLEVLTSLPIVWGDTATDWAVSRDSCIQVHAALALQAQKIGPAAALEALAHAVEPVAQRLAQQKLWKEHQASLEGS